MSASLEESGTITLEMSVNPPTVPDPGESISSITLASTSGHGTALQHAVLSALIPGAAQLTQGRWVAALAQFGVVVAYLLGVFAAGPTQALWLAVLWNAYSALEAYWYERHSRE